VEGGQLVTGLQRTENVCVARKQYKPIVDQLQTAEVSSGESHTARVQGYQNEGTQVNTILMCYWTVTISDDADVLTGKSVRAKT